MLKSLAARFSSALLLIVSLAYCSFDDYEQREEYVFHEPSGRARLNPFHAAGILLSRLELQAKSVSQIPENPGRNDSILLTSPSLLLSEARITELLEWVNNGGTLIYNVASHSATTPENSDHLLTALGASIKKQSSGNPDISIDFRSHGRYAPGHTERPERLRVRFRSSADSLIDDSGRSHWQVTKEGKTWLLHYHIGEGTVTLLSDFSPFYNRRIGELDHADFLWALLHLDTVPETVWLQFSPRLPSLWQLIWRYGWPVLIALALLLAAMIWTASQRLGPLVVPSDAAQRSLLEHLRASGRFIWRHGARHELLQAAYDYTGAPPRPDSKNRLPPDKKDMLDNTHEQTVARGGIRSHDFTKIVSELQKTRQKHG